MGLCKWSNKKKGFTLIELLVVMFLVGIMTTWAVLSLRSVTGEGQATWAQQLKTKFAQASDLSVLAQQDFGLYFSPQEVKFLAYKEKKWVPAIQDSLQAIAFPKGASVVLYVQHQLVVLKQEESVKLPQVWINAGVDYTPFELQVQVNQRKHVFKGSAVGIFSYEIFE